MLIVSTIERSIHGSDFQKRILQSNSSASRSNRPTVVRSAEAACESARIAHRMPDMAGTRHDREGFSGHYQNAGGRGIHQHRTVFAHGLRRVWIRRPREIQGCGAEKDLE